MRAFRFAATPLLAALAALLTWLPLSADADGKVFARAVEANPTIPDQRALIHFADGTERLVIETSFVGQGTNFAWVVPVPAVPEIEAVSPGVFPTLQMVFQPTIIHDVPPLFLFLLIAAAVIGTVLWIWRKGLGSVAVVACLLTFVSVVLSELMNHPLPFFVVTLVVLAWAWRKAGLKGAAVAVVAGFLSLVLFLPLSVKARGGSLSAQSAVEVLDRKVVGMYDTATIASTEAGALVAWLNANGFGMPTNVTPVAAEYVKEGWVFVAAKIRREADGKEANLLHPLAFTFKTTQPVYPLRLTGIDNDSCRIDLYVFGPGRADIPKFKVQRCSRVEYPAGDTTARGDGPAPPAPASLRIRQFSLRKLVEEAPVATKLSATLSPADMQTDALIAWGPFQSEGEWFYSQAAAGTRAANVFVPIALVGLWLVRLWSQRAAAPLRKSAAFQVCLLAMSVGGALMFFWVQPKKAVRLVYGGGRNACIANLKQIDGGIQQWALENKKEGKDTVTTNDVVGYLKGNVMPVCPMGGLYEVSIVGDEPTCTVPGHTL